MTATVQTIMIDCNDLDTMVAFWSAALDLDELARHPNYVWLQRVSDGGPALAFQQVPEPREGKNRLHLDLASADPAAFADKVISLGGSKVDDRESSGFHWTVLADPEGNLFCVTGTH